MIVTCKLLNEDGRLNRAFGCSLIFGAAMARCHSNAGRSAYLMTDGKIIAIYKAEESMPVVERDDQLISYMQARAEVITELKTI